MKRLFLPILTLATLISTAVSAQDSGTTISISGDSGTEQAAKLELIRVLQERLNKLTVAQLNSRIVVSSGVTKYYKVDEIYKMQKEIYAFRSKYVDIARNLESGNSGFSAGTGNGFTYKYLQQYNAANNTATTIKNQLDALLKSGNPIVMPQLPSFNIMASGSDPGAALAAQMKTIFDKFGITSQDDIAKLSADDQAKLQAQVKQVTDQFGDAFKQAIGSGNASVGKLAGTLIGTAFGVPGIGAALGGLLGGSTSGVSALVGSIVDQFQIPTDYYDSNTLKLTDAERLKIIDELHIRISDSYQQIAALATGMSTEATRRYNEISKPRNEVILYGPKKP